MFYYIEGNVTVIEQNAAILDTGGVGFFINTTTTTLSYLEVGKKAKLFTYVNIREDAFDIYGFHDMSEKRCFEMLLSVSGVGPKAALSILSSVTPEGLAMAIISENDKMLTVAPGIGKRIAQRIILELKDKMAKENISVSMPEKGIVQPAAGAVDKKMADAVAALTVLGYSPVEITAAMRGCDVQNMTVEEIIRFVLKGSAE